MNIILGIIAIIFAILRIVGIKTQAFQAFAHLFVGGLFGAYFAQGNKWLLVIAILLSLVELTVFGIGFFKSIFYGLS